MSIWGQLFTAMRGGVNDAAEGVVDAQSVRILDQQMRDAEAALLRAQTDLAGLMGKAKLARDRAADLEAKHARDMGVLERAVSQNQNDLAQELADRIATLESEIQRERAAVTELSSKETSLKNTVVTIRQRIQAMRREIDSVKVTESVQKAQQAIVNHGAGAASTLGNAAASLQRLKERQAARAAEFEAADKIAELQSGGELDRRLAAAGLLEGPGTGASVLARVRGQANAALAGPNSAGALPAPSAGALPSPMGAETTPAASVPAGGSRE